MPDLFFGTSGPRDATVAFVAESWGQQEDYAKAPLVGESGRIFNDLIAEAGLPRESVFVTNVIGAKPEGNNAWRFFEPTAGRKSGSVAGLFPSDFAKREVERLYSQLNAVRPKVVVALGNYALWALTNHAGHANVPKTRNSPAPGIRAPNGIARHRGSQHYQLTSRFAPDATYSERPLLPIIHPAAIMRQWSQRAVTLHDLRARIPQALGGDWRPSLPPRVFAPPSFERIEIYLHQLLGRLSSAQIKIIVDVETWAKSFMTCIGISGDRNHAYTIPFIRVNSDGSFSSYWSFRQEVEITKLLQRVLNHHNARVWGQNFLYDTRYIQRFLAVTPTFGGDTLLAHHLLFPALPKRLDYLSSLYCTHHTYWKDDNKEWDTKHEGFAQHLRYNAEDILRTYEISDELEALIAARPGYSNLWLDECDDFLACLDMMETGWRVDEDERARQVKLITNHTEQITSWLESMVPKALVGGAPTTPWWASPQQRMDVLYGLLRLPPETARKTGSRTSNKEALKELRKKYPRLAPLFNRLLVLGSYGVLHRTFLKAKLERGRLFCSFNPGGTSTFRFSSSKDPFGRGANLQNIPKGKQLDLELELLDNDPEPPSISTEGDDLDDPES